MRITILGCGTSAGVPQIGCGCRVCRSEDPRDKRRRCSILIEADDRRVLVDTGPDLRQQCIDAGIGPIDALLYTHSHADHVHGIDDLRSINNVIDAPINAYAHSAVFERIASRFPYVFEGGRSSRGGFWRPEITPHFIEPGSFVAAGLELVAFRQKHGHGQSWGFRVGPFAYSTDTDGLDDEAFAALRGVEVWIVDALRDRPHPSHAHLDRTLAWVDRVAPACAYLTHMNHEVAYADWASRLPNGVLPAHDGQVIDC